MRDKVAVLPWLNDNFQVHQGNFALRRQVFKQKVDRNKSFLVVAALSPMLQGHRGRKPGNNDGTTRHLSGRLVPP